MKITQDEILNSEVRALWWKQPYGSLMLHDKIETRTWDTKYRGLVLICASIKPYSYRQLINISGEFLIVNIYDTLVNDQMFKLNGYAIAIGRLADCRRMKIADQSKAFVQYRHDLFSHLYEDVVAIEPFKLKGSQGWRILTEDIKQKIKLCA
jgi:hypothetical protein